MEIRRDDLTGSQAVQLIREHFEHMRQITPPESVHALDLASLRSPDITFWTIWEGDELLGCGALRELDEKTGEIKSMRTANAHRRRGVASQMLKHIIQEAKQRGYDRLYLETGSFSAFAPAQALYQNHGFEYCSPFGEYTDDSNLVFMTKEL